MKDPFLSDGHLTENGTNLLGVVGMVILFSVAYFFDQWSGFWFWILALIGGGLGYVGAYGGLAKKFGFQAPFTNDPLGWRKAKESYSADAPQPDEKKQDQND